MLVMVELVKMVVMGVGYGKDDYGDGGRVIVIVVTMVMGGW